MARGCRPGLWMGCTAGSYPPFSLKSRSLFHRALGRNSRGGAPFDVPRRKLRSNSTAVRRTVVPGVSVMENTSPLRPLPGTSPGFRLEALLFLVVDVEKGDPQFVRLADHPFPLLREGDDVLSHVRAEAELRDPDAGVADYARRHGPDRLLSHTVECVRRQLLLHRHSRAARDSRGGGSHKSGGKKSASFMCISFIPRTRVSWGRPFVAVGSESSGYSCAFLTMAARIVFEEKVFTVPSVR